MTETSINSQPVRILQVVTYMGRGGIETMLMNYYRNIDRTKIQFDFLVHRDFEADFDVEIEFLGGHIYRIPPMNPMSSIYRKVLKNFFDEHRYSVVHCHLNYMSGVILYYAKKAGVPVRIAHAHTANMDPGWKQWVRKSAKYLIPFTATHLVACSKKAGDSVFGKHNYCLLANAIETQKYSFSSDIREKVRGQLKLDTSFAIMHVGRMMYPKNHFFLLDVFRKVHETIPDAKLVLIGDGELRHEIEKKISQDMLQDAVILLGTRNDVPELLQAADLFVFPSRFEGMPVTLIEAQATGLPCIKSDTVTDEAIVTDLVTSLPIDDPKCWAEEILKKRDVPRFDQSQAIISSGYDIHSAVKKLEQFYLNGDPL
ncbi:MAG: glycosyltransferase family 1 protein [Clostridia bacterium]|nr:glycosyltransferase family 1 protein [Clostridia bacterium]